VVLVLWPLNVLLNSTKILYVFRSGHEAIKAIASQAVMQTNLPEGTVMGIKGRGSNGPMKV
jgi:hypothetical protein